MCRCAVLFVLLMLNIIITVSARSSETAELHQSATLRCSWICRGVVKWSVFNKPGIVLTRCDQTSCSSQQDGYVMSHDQYLQGDLSLSISAADYSMRGLYTCQCEDKDVCDVRLFIKTVETRRVVPPGEPIDVFLPITDHVEVTFTATDSVQPSDLKICTVDQEKIQSAPQYKDRVSRINAVQIKDGKVSDSGNYTVRDTLNNEEITIINVQVTGEPQPHLRRPRSPHSPREQCPDNMQEGDVPLGGAAEVWVTVSLVLSVLLVVFVSAFVVLLVFYVRLKKEHQQLRNKVNNKELILNAGNGH